MMDNIKFAINYLIKNKYKLLEDDNNYGNQSIKMAIEALAKQIPKQIMNLDTNYPKCCPDCGQRLDWSVEE